MPEKTNKVTKTPSPADLRNMFGANLRHLASNAVSISALCRDLHINRTQFNRYLAGESFPRPDVLHRICSFFDVDARILLEPVETISNIGTSGLNHPEVRDFLTSTEAIVEPTLFPDGIYRFCRRSFLDDDQFVIGLAKVYRKDERCFLRGYEAKEAMRSQGLPETSHEREFRGSVLPQEGGVAMLISRRNSLTFSFNFVSPVNSFKNNHWIGYTARTAPEGVTGSRAARLVVEKLDNTCGEILAAARSVGYCTADELLPYHRNLLRIDANFR